MKGYTETVKLLLMKGKQLKAQLNCKKIVGVSSNEKHPLLYQPHLEDVFGI